MSYKTQVSKDHERKEGSNPDFMHMRMVSSNVKKQGVRNVKVEYLESAQRARATIPAAIAPTRARLAAPIEAPLVLVVVELEGLGLVAVLVAVVLVPVLVPVEAEPPAVPVREGRAPVRVTPCKNGSIGFSRKAICTYHHSAHLDGKVDSGLQFRAITVLHKALPCAVDEGLGVAEAAVVGRDTAVKVKDTGRVAGFGALCNKVRNMRQPSGEKQTYWGAGPGRG